MTPSNTDTVICRYRVKKGRESAMEELLTRHWATLHAAGLTTENPPRYFRGRASERSPEHGSVYVEIFEWKTADSAHAAHEMPEVMALWEPMGDCCDEMEFPHFESLDL